MLLLQVCVVDLAVLLLLLLLSVRGRLNIVSARVRWVMIKIPPNLSGLQQLGLFLTHSRCLRIEV